MGPAAIPIAIVAGGGAIVKHNIDADREREAREERERLERQAREAENRRIQEEAKRKREFAKN